MDVTTGRFAAARGTRTAITGYYGLTGVLTALWGATLPATEARLDLGAGRLGTALMALAAGVLIAMPVAGAVVGRWPTRRVLGLALLAAAAAVSGPALADSFVTLTSCALVLGIAIGALNVALSVHAIAVERVLGRPIMASLHGSWTLGAVAGGAAVSAALRGGSDVVVLMIAGAAAVAAAGLILGRGLGELRGSGGAPAADITATATVRPGTVAALGFLGAAAFLAEGAATDWAGLYATRVLHADPATGSLSYTGFFAAMTVVRLLGDPIRARLGAALTIRLAGCTATVAYALVLLSAAAPASAQVPVAIAGWVLSGAGMALVWPVVTSALGAAGAAAGTLSAVTTISYAGGLAGPALIGYLAAALTLPMALLIPAAAALMLAAVAPTVVNSVARAPVPANPY